jgi:hypothetical protein
MNIHTDKNLSASMTSTQRWAGLYTVVLMLLLLAFFAYHQWQNTGFFTTRFGTIGMLALYVPIVLSLAPPVLRAIQGRRNPSRPLEAFGDLILAIGSLILRNTFPFDFTHFADPFPSTWHFAFAWLTNDVGKFILLLQIFIGFISATAIIATYVSIRRKELG